MKLHRLLQNASAHALIVGVALMGLPATAAAQTWTGAVDNDYNNPGNWSTGSVPPTSGTVVTVNGRPTAPVVDGVTSSASSGLIVGDGGAAAGQLTVRNGGRLIGIGQTNIGGSSSGVAGGNGNVLVTGAGSLLQNTNQIIVGLTQNARGTLTIDNGGTVRGNAGLFGAGEGSVATVTVRGADSLLDLTGGLLSLGSNNVDAGRATLNVLAGGRVTGGNGTTNFVNSVSAINISGANSLLTSGASLTINGALLIEDGGTLNYAQGLAIGGAATMRNGTISVPVVGSAGGLGIVAGGTLIADASTITVGSNLSIAGAATLRGTTVRAAAIGIFQNGILNIGGAEGAAAGAPGAIVTPSITVNEPNSRLVFNHTGPDLVVNAAIRGNGRVLHLAGTTVLTTAPYSGGVTGIDVTGGSLFVDGRITATTLTLSNGATFAGTGTLNGSVAVSNGIITPGNRGVGRLTIGNLSLTAASILNFELGAPGTPGVGSDLITVGNIDNAGNVTLDGTLNVASVGAFGAGLYRLIDYSGTLTNNGLLVGAVPGGFSATDLTVQTSVARQVNLIVAASPPAFSNFSFWDGANTTANRAVDGGTGNWTTTGRNWTVSTGEANGVYDPTQLLIFAGTSGVATVDTTSGAVVIGLGLQFAVNGYRVDGGALTLGTNAITLRVGDGTAAGAAISATIASDLVGGASIEKTDLGTLILTGSAAPTAGTTITNGTLQIGAGGAGGAIGGDIANNGALVFNRAGTLAYAAVVSGSGALEQRGPGTTTLSGVHSYIGLTTISAGTLANSGTIVGATSVLAVGTLTNAGTLATVTNAGTGTNTGTMGALTNTAGSFTNNGTINGAVGNSAGATFATTSTLNGSLTNSGTARIGGIVNGALDNRAGSVTVTAGTTGIVALTQSAGASLNLAGFALTAGSVAGDGAVQLGAGSLTTGGSNASTVFAGIISGTGRLVKTGTGQLTLSGANSYSGGTTVAAGTLAGNSTSLQGAIANDGRVRFDQSAAGIYAGALSGTGLLEKAGAGRLDLTGIGTMSGGTSVLGGELAVNGSLARSIVTIGTGARLGGSGTVSGIVAQSGSTVAPGNSVGTLSVQGNVMFAAGSTFAVEVQGPTADRITATGTAQLAGTLAVTAVGGPYTFGTPYVLLSATGGRTGTFDTTTGLAGFGPGIRPTVSYDATTVTLRLDPNALGPILTGIALTPNQQSAQQRFDAAIAGGSTNPVPFFAIFNLPVAQLPTALDALSAEVYASAARIALDDERMVRKSTLDQLRSTSDVTGTTAWGAGFGTFGRIASDGNAARVTRDTSGFITGIDTGGALDSDDSSWRIGVQGHYLRTSFGIADRASSGSVTRTGGGIHGALKLGGFGVRVGATLASVKINTTRAIAATGFSEQGVAAVNGTAFQAFGEIGYTIGNNRASVEPFAGLAVSRLKLGAIAESGGVSAVTVKARDYSLTLADLGLRGRLRMTPGDKAAIDLKAALAIRQVIGGQALASSIAFASVPGLDFSIATVAQDKKSFVPEIGFDADLGGGATVHLTYSGVIGKRAQDHDVKAGIRIAF